MTSAQALAAMRVAACLLLLAAAPLLAGAPDLTVRSVSPSSGSPAGGTVLHVGCHGLTLEPRASAPSGASGGMLTATRLAATAEVAVAIGGIPCDVLWARCEPELIVCRTRPVTEGDTRLFAPTAAQDGTPQMPVSLTVLRPGAAAAVAVGAGSNGTFRYRGAAEWDLAPVIERVVPPVARPGDELAVHGRGVPPEPAAVGVTVGGVPAAVVRRGTGVLSFRVPATLSAGSHNVSFYVDGVGASVLASTALRVDRAGVVHALQVLGRVLARSPAIGSAASGGALTIWAAGIGAGELSRVAVEVDGTTCAVNAGSLANGSFSCALGGSTAAQEARRSVVAQRFVGHGGVQLDSWAWSGGAPPSGWSLRASPGWTGLPAAGASSSVSLSDLGWELPGAETARAHRQRGWLVRPQWPDADDWAGRPVEVRLRVRSTAAMVEVWLCEEAAASGGGLDGTVTDGLMRVATLAVGNSSRTGVFGSAVVLDGPCRFEVVAVETSSGPRQLTVEPLFTERPPALASSGLTVAQPIRRTIKLSSTAVPEQQLLQRPALAPDLASLMWGSRVTAPFVLTANDTTAMQAAIESLASAHCVGATSGTVFRRFDYEQNTVGITTGVPADAFCGRRSLVAHGRSVELLGARDSYRTKEFPFLCTGHKVVLARGLTLGRLTVELAAAGPRYIDLVSAVRDVPSDVWGVVGDWMMSADGSWHGSCIDLDVFLDRELGGQDHRIISIDVEFENVGQAMLDAFTIRSTDDPLVQTEPLGIGGVILDTLVVDADASDTGGIDCVFNLTRLGCTGVFPLLSMNGVRASRAHEAGDVLSGSVKLTGHGELPVEFDMSQPDSEDDVLRAALAQAVSGVVSVERSGCYAMDLHLELDPSASQAAMAVADCNLVGMDATVSIQDTAPGGYMMSHVPYDWLRTVEDAPQVQVTLDGVPLTCASGCDFSFVGAGATPAVAATLPPVLERSTIAGDEACAHVPGFVACRGTHCIPASQRCLAVQSVSPQTSSFFGGQQLTITGGGFAVSTTVDVGGTGCMVDSWNDDQIVCTIAHTAKTHTITNSGVHPSLGPGFLWDRSDALTVYPGDTVRWSWASAWVHTAALHTIVHTNTSSQEFRSPSSSSGVLEHVFTVPGLYLFASEEYASTGMSGSIIVAPRQTRVADVTIATSTTSASYTSPLASQALTSCSAVPAPAPPPATTQPAWMNTPSCGFLVGGPSVHAFEDCQGSCLPRGSCQAVVACRFLAPPGMPHAWEGCNGGCVPVGLCPDRLHCDGIENDRCAQLVQAELLTCGAAVVMGGECALAVRCKCLGPANSRCAQIVEDDPCVSMLRGGFSCSQAEAQGFACSVAEDCGQCESGFVPRTSGDCDAPLTSVGKPQIVLSGCTALTPSIMTVSPTKVIPGDTITVQGIGFGSPVVRLGQTVCTTVQATATSVSCTVPSLPGGAYSLSMSTPGKGFTAGSFTVAVQAVISGVAASQASGLGGGTTVTITGSGFLASAGAGTTVMLGSTPCSLVSASTTQIVCETGKLVDSGFAAAAIADGAVEYWSFDSLDDLSGSQTSGVLSGLVSRLGGVGEKTPIHWPLQSSMPSYILTFDGSQFDSLSVGGQSIVRQANIVADTVHGAPTARFNVGSVLTMQPIPLLASWSVSVWFIGPLVYTGSAHCLMYGSDGSEHVYVPANLQDLGVMTVQGVSNLQFEGSGVTKLGRLADGWHHLAVVAGGGEQSYYLNGEYVGRAAQQVNSDIIAVGNKPSGTQPWGAINSFVLYSGTLLSASQIASSGTSHYQDSGMLFSDTASGLVTNIAPSYGFGGELSVEFWVRKPSAYVSNSNFRRQMIMSGVDDGPNGVSSGFVFWVNPCGELEMWVRLVTDGADFHSSCMWPTMEELQCDAYLFSNCPTTGGTCSLPEIRVGNQAWSVLKDPGFTSTSFSEWIHVVGSYSGRTQSLYRGGTLIDSRQTAIVAPSNVHDVNMQLGGAPAWTTTGVLPFTGGLDEVALYTYIFSAADATRHATYGTGTLQKLSVLFDGARAVCPVSDCSIGYDPALTAVLHGVAPSAGFAGAVLTLTGQALASGVVDVQVGPAPCNIITSTSVEITCTITTPVPGLYPVIVTVAGVQAAVKNSQTLFFLHQAQIVDILPTTGSLQGGTHMQIGLVDSLTGTEEITVLLGDVPCVATSALVSTVQCVSGSRNAPGSVAVNVYVNGILAQGGIIFLYYTSSTPEIFTVAPSSGFGGDLLRIDGRWFSPVAAENTVTIGGEPCVVQTCAADFIECVVGYSPASLQVHTVVIHVSGKGDAATSSIGTDTFQYSLAVSALSTLTSSFGGDLLVAIGAGLCTYDAACTEVIVCGQLCVPISSAYARVECNVPPMIIPADGSELECNVTVAVGGVTIARPDLQITFNEALTPRLTSVSPQTGSTGGGTRLIVEASGLSPISAEIDVRIGGAECVVEHVWHNDCTDTTTPFELPSWPSPVQRSCAELMSLNWDCGRDMSIPALNALTPRSSGYSSGVLLRDHCTASCAHAQGVNCSVPNATHVEGLICRTSQRAALDTSVAVRVSAKGFALKTPTPAVATFHYYDLWSTPRTWDGGVLPEEGASVVIPSTQIVLLDLVPPPLFLLMIDGGNLVFDRRDLSLNTSYLLIVNGGHLEIGTPTRPFVHECILSLTASASDPPLPFFGTSVLALADGIVDMHGSPRISWTRFRETAAAGATELRLVMAVQWQAGDTVVLGSSTADAGDAEEVQVEAVSNNGLTVTLTEPLTSTHLGEHVGSPGCDTVQLAAEIGVLNRNIVVCGGGVTVAPSTLGAATLHMSHVAMQAVHQLADRYPIHLHNAGDVSTSFVRGCSIVAANGGIRVRKSHRLNLQDNVIVTSGHSFSVEDCDDIVLRGNLGMAALKSADVTAPSLATFLISTVSSGARVYGNAAAGSAGHGFMFSQRAVDVGATPATVEFTDNTAHSSLHGVCFKTAAEASAAPTFTIQGLTAYLNRDCGVMLYGNAHIDGSAFAGNVKSNVLVTGDSSVSLEIRQSVVMLRPYAGTSANAMEAAGITIDSTASMLINGVHFVHYDSPTSVAINLVHSMSPFGAQIRADKLQFCQSPQRVSFAQEHQALIRDVDGSLTGAPGWAVPLSGILPPSYCRADASLSAGGHNGSSCTDAMRLVRLRMRTVDPPHVAGPVTLANTFGASVLPRSSMADEPYTALVPTQSSYTFRWNQASYVTLRHFAGTVVGMQPDDSLSVEEVLDLGVDFIVPHALDAVSFNETLRTLATVVTGPQATVTQVHETSFESRLTLCPPLQRVDVFSQAVGGCHVPALLELSNNCQLWSNALTWAPGSVPVAAQDVVIAHDMCVVLDVSTPALGRLTVKGDLQFLDTQDLTLTANHLRIEGGRVMAGSMATPFAHRLTLVIGTNDASTRAIEVYGVLQLVGPKHEKTWTRLSATTPAGGFVARLQERVDWAVGNTVVLASSAENGALYETAEINQVSVDGKLLALDRNLRYDHTAGTHLVEGTLAVDVSPEIGLLTRGIVIDGSGKADCGIRVAKHWKWEGSVVLQAVELTGCADAGGTNPMVEFQQIGIPLPLRREYFRASQVQSCSFHGGSSTAIQVSDSSHVTVDGNVIVATAWSAVVVRGVGNKLKDTMGISVSPTPECVAGTCSNACATRPCQNGAVCVNAEGGQHFCACSRGWNGKSCDVASTDVNGTACAEEIADQASCPSLGVCDAEPCLNAGICVADAQADAGFFCSCTESFRGQLCDVSIEELKATFDITGEGNVVSGTAAAGSTRVGFRITVADVCRDTAASISSLHFHNNVAHSNLIGLQIIKAEGVAECAEVAFFRTFRNWDLGIYAHTRQNLHIRDSFVAESVIGVLLNSYGPDPTLHLVEDKTITISRTAIVGRLSTSTCAAQAKPPMSDFRSFPASQPRVGLLMSSFTRLPLQGRDAWSSVDSSYPALSGAFHGLNMTFADFGPSTRCARADTSSIAIANNQNTQAGHPHYFSGTRFARNARGADFLFTPGNTDAARHSAVFDKEGALGGGLLVPLGNGGDGVELPSDACMPVSRLGVRRCPVSPAPTHRMLVFESMDSDTESRVIAPLALTSASANDSLNGPTVMVTNATGLPEPRSLSAFFPIVGLGEPYNASFAGGNPYHIRLHMLHAESEDAVLLRLKYSGVSERLDVYILGALVPSSGIVRVDGRSERVHGAAYMPTLDASPTGANNFDDSNEELYLLVKGAAPIEIVMAPVLKVALGLIMEQGAVLSKVAFVADFAVVLGVDPAHVVIVRVTAASARRRQQSGGGSQIVTVEADVGVPPSSTRTTGAPVVLALVQAAQSTLTTAAATLVSLVQAGSLANALSSTGVGAVSGLSIVLPVGLDRTAPPTLAGGFLVQIPYILQLFREPEEQYDLNENFTIAGAVNDAMYRPCTVLGLEKPWNLTASIKPGTGAPGAKLSGPTVVYFSQGIGTFDGLSIDLTADGYVIELLAENGFSAETQPFTVGDVPPPFNPWSIVFAVGLVCIIGGLYTGFVWQKRRALKRIVPMASLLDGIEHISMRIPTPDLQYLPRPASFVGVSIDDMFARDRTTAATLLPTQKDPCMLEVEVIRARNLKRMDLGGFGKSDPFCVVGQGKTDHYSEVIDADLNPVWHESFSMWVKDESKDLVVTMFDKDTGGADIMGEVSFKLAELMPHTVMKQWHVLKKAKIMKPKETVKGDIQLAIKYSPKLGEPHQLPLVLRQMFDTLEDEGINQVGIFRLPSDEAAGSMKRLKKKHAVHKERLSALRYDDDAMALANLLVYTLASFPEPLMATDALDSCVKMGMPLIRLKSTAVHARYAAVQGRVEAMLHGMPDTHYLVLMHLLGLLYRFSKNCAVNLMTAHNLAVAFAPVVWRVGDDGGKTPALAALLRLFIELGPMVLRKSKLQELTLKELIQKAATEGIDMDDLEGIQEAQLIEGPEVAKKKVLKLILENS